MSHQSWKTGFVNYARFPKSGHILVLICSHMWDKIYILNIMVTIKSAYYVCSHMRMVNLAYVIQWPTLCISYIV